MKIIIDRIEENIAVCELESGETVNIPLCIFENAKEGDVFNIVRDDSAREERMSKAKSLFDKLKK
ncbi:MAG: DUF3006 domain-containing protein [Clostridia bacterium]|nr:DUF3006 domain-containing protein [Clostridia bacterium]